MAEKPEYKICSQCNLKKVVDEFPFDNKELNQRRANCKDCKNVASKKAYEQTRDDPESVARRIIKSCKAREKERLAKFVKRRDELDYMPEVELTNEQFDIDVEWMLAQRDKQNNKCYYSNKDMIWSTGLIGPTNRINPEAVTIERLDSDGCYVKSNCVLACWRANCFKGDGSYEEMLGFASAILHKYTSEVLKK